jgi:hypothetical protein
MLEQDQYTRSYLALRRIMGILGILLPFVVCAGHYLRVQLLHDDLPALRPSISDYYYTIMGDYFVGTLCVIGIFLVYYTGFDKWDNRLGNVAGTFAFGVAFFPTPEFEEMTNVGIIHFVSATICFLCLAGFSFFLFTKTKPGEKVIKGTRKYQRNLIYRACGIIILLCILAIAANKFVLPEGARIANLTLYGETVALVVFGFSWLVKGETLLTDKKQA